MSFLGCYEARVVDNVDPEHHNRVKVLIVGIHSEKTPAKNLPWAKVCVPLVGYGQGKLPNPPKGSDVIVMFKGGHPDHPIVVGCYATTLDVVNAPTNGYAAGDKQEITEGSLVNHTAGNRTHTTQGSFIEAVTLLSKLVAQSREMVIKGKSTETVGTLISEVKGDATNVVGGSSDLQFLSDVAIAVTGKLIASIAKELDVVTLAALKVTTEASSITLESVASTLLLRVLDPTHIIPLSSLNLTSADATLDAAIIRLGTNAVQNIALAPLVLVALQQLAAAIDGHSHVGHGAPPTPIPGVVPVAPLLGEVGSLKIFSE